MFSDHLSSVHEAVSQPFPASGGSVALSTIEEMKPAWTKAFCDRLRAFVEVSQNPH